METETDPLEAALLHLQAQLDLDAEREHKVMAELRTHLEEAMAEAQSIGLSTEKALAEAMTSLGSVR